MPSPSLCDLHSPEAVQRRELLGPQGSICNLSSGDFTCGNGCVTFAVVLRAPLHPSWHLAVSVALAIVSQFCCDFSPHGTWCHRLCVRVHLLPPGTWAAHMTKGKECSAELLPALELKPQEGGSVSGRFRLRLCRSYCSGPSGGRFCPADLPEPQLP